jgi:hypothetical protein
MSWDIREHFVVYLPSTRMGRCGWRSFNSPLLIRTTTETKTKKTGPNDLKQKQGASISGAPESIRGHCRRVVSLQKLPELQKFPGTLVDQDLTRWR